MLRQYGGAADLAALNVISPALMPPLIGLRQDFGYGCLAHLKVRSLPSKVCREGILGARR
jgi:hypothetical protein